MFTFSILLLVFLFLIFQNILLLNEETLILLCFIAFCWIVSNHLSRLINTNFSNRSTKIEHLLTSSLSQTEEVLNNGMSLQQKLWNLKISFKNLEDHFTKLNKTISGNLVFYLIQNSQVLYLNKLNFIQRLEQQTTKLLVLLLSKKLYRTVLIRQFYAQKLKFPSFLCFYKISLREYFKTI